jgi:hypothetical protein
MVCAMGGGASGWPLGVLLLSADIMPRFNFHVVGVLWLGFALSLISGRSK